MQVACPQCRKRYDLADEKIGETGIRVRCPACAKQFNVTPPDHLLKTHVRPKGTVPFETERPSIQQPSIHAEVEVLPRSAEATNEFRHPEIAVSNADLPPLPPSVAEEGVFTDRDREEDEEVVVSGSGEALPEVAPVPAHYRIPMRYALIPALIPLAIFALYLLALHFPQLWHLRLARVAQDALDTTPLREDTRNLYLKAKFWQYLDDSQTLRQAGALLDRALSLQPDQPKLLGAKAELLAYSAANAEQAALAAPLALRALAREPLNREALRVLSHLFLNQDEAVSTHYLQLLLNQVFRGFLETTDAETRWLLALHHLKHGNLFEAQINLEKATELNPYFLRCYLELAEIGRQQKDLEKERRYRSLYESMRQRLKEKIAQETKS